MTELQILSKEQYEEWDRKRAEHLKSIVSSLGSKNILVAGPGTGKTFTFKEICEDVGSGQGILVITFINELVKDLTKNLTCFTDSVNTLHSFALGRSRGKDIFFNLDKVIGDDYFSVTGTNINYSKNFHNLNIEKDSHEFYVARKNYYKHESPNSIVYTVLRYYEDNPHKIPKNYKLLLVDEYQDFNKLEAKFIDVLSKNSSVLLVGDDEQALYTDLRDANPELIRGKFRDDDWKKFQLPYCSRSTRVIVEAYNQIVDKAVKEGYFNNRIKEKKFLYFRNKAKDKLSILYPRIVFRKNLPNKAGLQAYYVKNEISKLYKTDPDSSFDVLVICTSNMQVQKVAKSLKKQGFTNVLTNKDKDDENIEDLIKALDLLAYDENSNLGWRLLCEVYLPKPKLKKLIKDAHATNVDLVDRVPDKEKLVKLVKAYKKVLSETSSPTEQELNDVFKFFDIEPNSESRKFVAARHKKIIEYSKYPFSDTPVKVTTMTGSKGLSYDYVFMINFSDDIMLGRQKPTDIKISNFLVSLTRAKKLAYITTKDTHKPTFLEWIDNSLIKEVEG